MKTIHEVHAAVAPDEQEGLLFDIGYEDGVTPCLAVPERTMPNGVRAG